MISDLAALMPPALVALAFLAAVVAFLRHEMRRSGNAGDEDSVKVSTKNPTVQRRNQDAPGEGEPAGRSSGDEEGSQDV